MTYTISSSSFNKDLILVDKPACDILDKFVEKTQVFFYLHAQDSLI